MSLTNIRNDKCRVEKEMQIMTEEGRYMLNVPGPGNCVGFEEDPHIRLQKWGANLHNNTINVESDLKGMTRLLTKDCLVQNNYARHVPSSCGLHYKTTNPYVEQSRATAPAWIFRELPNNRWNYLPLDPQAHIEKPFYNNISTRIIEKDNYDSCKV
jgi:hypothetical protein